jgi:Ankyrin repeats (3 copies)
MNATTATTLSPADQRLFQAVSESRISEIRALILRDGANVAAQYDATTQSTPLHWAAGNGNYSVTRTLLELGAPVHARNAKGETALHHATSVDREKVARLLLDHGADLYAQDQGGRTPVSRQVAATERLANILLQHKKEQDRWCNENETLLAVVASKNATKLQNMVHTATTNFTNQLQEQKMQLLQRQDETFQSLQATTRELQGRVSFLEEQQQQKQPNSMEENDVNPNNDNKHHIMMSPGGGGGGGPPKKRQKGLWLSHENNNNNIDRVSFCEEQLKAQRAEIAALRQLVVLKMTSSSCSGGIPAMDAAVGVEKNTKILVSNGVAAIQNKVKMEQPQPLQATSSPGAGDEIAIRTATAHRVSVLSTHDNYDISQELQQQQASTSSSSASSSDDENDDDQAAATSSSSLLAAALQLELQHVRVELLKSQANAKRYKQQRDAYKMQRDEYKSKMEQLHRLTSSLSPSGAAGAGFGPDEDDIDDI